MQHIRYFIKKLLLREVAAMGNQQPTTAKLFLAFAVFGIPSIRDNRNLAELEVVVLYHLTHFCHTNLLDRLYKRLHGSLLRNLCTVRKGYSQVTSRSTLYLII